MLADLRGTGGGLLIVAAALDVDTAVVAGVRFGGMPAALSARSQAWMSRRSPVPRLEVGARRPRSCCRADNSLDGACAVLLFLG